MNKKARLAVPRPTKGSNLSIIRRHPGTWVRIGRSDRSDHGPTVRPRSDPSDPPLDRTIRPWSDHITLAGRSDYLTLVRLSNLVLTFWPWSDCQTLVQWSDLSLTVRPQSDRPTSVQPSDLGPTVRPWSNSPTVRPPSDRPTSVRPSDLSPTVRPQSNSPTLVPWSVLSPTIQPQSNFLASVCSNLFQWSDCPTMVSPTLVEWSI